MPFGTKEKDQDEKQDHDAPASPVKLEYSLHWSHIFSVKNPSQNNTHKKIEIQEMNAESPVINAGEINPNIFINVLASLNDELHDSVHYRHIECRIVFEYDGQHRGKYSYHRSHGQQGTPKGKPIDVGRKQGRSIE